MNQNIKNVLGVAGIIAILAGGYAAVGYVDAFSKSIQPSSFRSFTVTGESKVVAVPDVASFNFSVRTEGGKDLTKLQADNTANVNKAIAFLKNQGIDAKDIQTEQYSVEPRYQSYDCSSVPMPAYAPTSQVRIVKPCPPPEVVGYTVMQSVSVKARDFSKVGAALSGVVQNGANQVSSLSFVIDDPSKVQSAARIKAIEKAKEKADAVAKAGGFRIGRLLGIEEGGFQGYANYTGSSLKAYDAMNQAVAPAPAIEPGSQDVSVTVTLRYEIE